MSQSQVDQPWKYDLFISYARFDEQLQNFASVITDRIRLVFRELTGREARIFLDTAEIASAALWQSRIESALTASATLVVIETPSYFTSQWCTRELDNFLVLEAERRRIFQLQPHESLIFPVIRTSSNLELSGTDVERQRHSALSARQAVSLENFAPNDPTCLASVDLLVRDIISVLQRLVRPQRGSMPDYSPQQIVGSSVQATTPLVMTYSGPDSRKVIELLADAHAVTVVGIANEEISDVLERAIIEKRRRVGDANAFWDQLQIVFLAEGLLGYVDDVLSAEFSDPMMATQERIRRAALSRRRLMSLLLRYGSPDRWSLYSYPFLLPFAGILFVMPDGKRVVQLRMMRPSRRETEYLKIEFIDRVDQFFESAFREIVRGSSEEHEIVIVGVPDQSGDSFMRKGSRFRRSVLVDGLGSPDWIAALLVITWRQAKDGPELLLQIRTPKNSTREMGKVSHLAGYINDGDHELPDIEALALPATELVLPMSTAENAVRRELSQHLGIQASRYAPVHVANSPFYYADKENLFFYLFTQEIDASQRFSSDAQLFSWTIGELMAVRRHQVISLIDAIVRADMTGRQRSNAVALAVSNLQIQGDSDLVPAVRDAIMAGSIPNDLQRRLEAISAETATFKYSAGRELEADGLAGLQYRIFYSKLLPTYASLGIKAAEEHLDRLAREADCSAVADALAQMYNDESFISSIPVEV